MEAAEKIELEFALSETEGAHEQVEIKVLRCQLELTQVRQEIECRMAEKDEEFAATKKNMNKGIGKMQSLIFLVVTEALVKSESLRMKKKLESDVSELDTSLEHATAANVETQKSIKVYSAKIREAQSALEDQQRAKEVCRDQLIASERKAHSVQNALEEARTLLEQADRGRRSLEQELQDSNETLADLSNQNQAVNAAKRKLENELNTLTVSEINFIDLFLISLHNSIKSTYTYLS